LVVVKLKDFEEIVAFVKTNRLAILGCELGAGRCLNGGLKKAKALKEKFENLGFTVVTVKTVGGACVLEHTEKMLGKLSLGKDTTVVSLSCGAGTQVIAEYLGLPTVSATDTLFIGAEKKGLFERYCDACGDCIISQTGAICPVSRCPKSLRSAPCGGAVNGKCEVNGKPCVWFEIERRVKVVPRVIIPNYQKVFEAEPAEDE
jgi:hypothetical protein